MKPEDKLMLTFGLAALFRAATIAGQPANVYEGMDRASIEAAQRFVATCEQLGVLPKELP